MPSTARTAILTGTVGAVAGAVSSALARSGWRTVLHPLGPGAATPERAPDQAEAVVHLGVRSPRDLEEGFRTEIETGAARAAAALASRVGARRLVHVSTTGVYGKPRNLPCREGELKAPRTSEERIRWAAERESWAAFRLGAPLTVLRPAILYGPGLRGGAARLLSLASTFLQRRRRVPILRRGPVAHLVHLDDLASATAFVLDHADDGDVVGRAFNVADEAPLPLAEHLATALGALGYETGRVLPSLPRLAGALLWLLRRVPDRALLDPLNRRLSARWFRLAERDGIEAAPSLVPRIDRESAHAMAADHYFDTSRLAGIGWRPAHPVSTGEVAAAIRALVAARLLPGNGPGALPSR